MMNAKQIRQYIEAEKARKQAELAKAPLYREFLVREAGIIVGKLTLGHAGVKQYMAQGFMVVQHDSGQLELRRN